MCNSLTLSYVLSVMAAIFNLPVTATSERVHISPAVLLNPENEGVAFGILSLIGIEAEILRYFICTSSNGGHLGFSTYSDFGRCSH